MVPRQDTNVMEGTGGKEDQHREPARKEDGMDLEYNVKKVIIKKSVGFMQS